MNEYEKKHKELLRSFGAECTVLLKTDGAFPLRAPCALALYGSGARQTIKGGTGSGEVNSRHFVTIEEGLENAGFTLTSKAWLERYGKVREEAKKRFISDLKRSALKRGTLAIISDMGAVMPEPEYDIPLNAGGDNSLGSMPSQGHGLPRNADCDAAPTSVSSPGENLPRSTDGEAAIYVLSRISGEGSDRRPVPGDILLTETETRDILSLNEKYEKFFLVLNVGGVVDLSPVMAVRNILLLSQLGDETGSILADIVLGKSTPSGKLTTTWAAFGDYSSVGSFGERDDTRYKEGIYVGYRYFDTLGKCPLFPFGYGLSYTSFSITPGPVRVEGEAVTVVATVKNTGKCPGKEVVQLYVSPPDASPAKTCQLPEISETDESNAAFVSPQTAALDKPFQSLAAFAKTKNLLPEEEETLELSFCLRDLASYDEARAFWILEPGDYILRLGNSSRDTEPIAVIRLDTEAILKKVKNCLGRPDFTDRKPQPQSQSEAIPVIVASRNDTTCHSEEQRDEESRQHAPNPDRILRFAQNDNCSEKKSDEDSCHHLSNPDGILRFAQNDKRSDAQNHVFSNDNRTIRTDCTDDLSIISVRSSTFPTETVVYGLPETIDPLVEQLSDEDLCLLNIGAFKGAGINSVIGNASNTVAGAAGETAGICKEQGVPVLVMADGPAGLRLSRLYTKDEKGVHPQDGGIPESMMELMPAPVAFFLKHFGGNKKPKSNVSARSVEDKMNVEEIPERSGKGKMPVAEFPGNSGKTKKPECEILEQNCTAIPVGTALAQSWNLAFAEACGDLVGDEMERFGVHLWLAPALNIHRSICCGRNFEYYSEDPLISGKFAAAVTRGVQRHPGRATTIKHFAANNQETNRYNSNSQTSERTLREIYLRGFEIAVKESQPHALMTSYNLINGIHTSEHRGLIEDILRAEFGFCGIVMTDWIVGTMSFGKKKYPAPNAAKIAAAGNNLIMPGGPGDLKALKKGLKNGLVTRRQLAINASRVVQMAKRLGSRAQCL